MRIYKTYGQDAVRVISENPYRLARDIRGIGSLTADRIAERLGIARTAMIRVRAGLLFALPEAMDEGHCGLVHWSGEPFFQLAAKRGACVEHVKFDFISSEYLNRNLIALI